MHNEDKIICRSSHHYMITESKTIPITNIGTKSSSVSDEFIVLDMLGMHNKIT